MPTACSDISTDRADRYLVQLCEHLSRIGHHAQHGSTPDAAAPPRVQGVEWTDTHGVIRFAAGQCTLEASEHGLTITLAADDDQELSRMQELFATRLETIGRRDGLTVAW